MRTSHKLLTILAGGIVYLLRDEFSTAEGPPIANPHTSQPGPGIGTVTDVGSKTEILANYFTALTDNPGTDFDQHKIVWPSVARVAGRALFFKHRNGANGGNITAAGFNANGTLGSGSQDQSIATSYNGASTIDVQLAATGLTESNSTVYPYSIILQATGALFFAQLAGVWNLIAIEHNSPVTPLVPFVSIWRQKADADDGYASVRLRDMGGLFAVAGGLATVNVTASSGVTQTADADGFYDLYFTLPAGSANLVAVELRYRYQDANNYWTAYVKRNAGNTNWDCYLDKVTAGTPATQAGFPVTNIGNANLIEVVTNGTAHRVWTRTGVTLTNRGGTITDAAFQASTTIDPIAGAGTTLGALICYPKTSANYNPLSAV